MTCLSGSIRPAAAERAWTDLHLLITEITKYLICMLMLIYVTESFLAFRYRDARHLRGVCRRQSIWMFAIHALLFAQIIVGTMDTRYLFYYAVQLLILVSIPSLFTRLFPDGYRVLVNHMCMLLMIGMTMILRVDESKALRQMIFAAVSFLLGFFVTELLKRWKSPDRLSVVYAAVGIAAIGIVLILGSVTYGSKISFTLFGLTFQPSEFVKILYVMFLAGALRDRPGFKRIVITGVVAAAHVLILVFSKDLGSALIFFVVFVCMVYVSTGNPVYIALGGVFGAGACLIAYRLFAHVRTRVAIWQNPWALADNEAYQITQSLFGISGGGFLGRGMFNGAPDMIPFVEEDLMFAAIAEEMGLLFAVMCVLICLSTFLTFLYNAFGMENDWRRLVTVGIGVTYIFQVFLTVGGSVKFIPLTGVTLPLVSYGGSSVLSTVLMFSVFEGIFRAEAEEIAVEEEVAGT